MFSAKKVVTPVDGMSYISPTLSGFWYIIRPCTPMSAVRPVAICCSSTPPSDMPPRSWSAGWSAGMTAPWVAIWRASMLLFEVLRARARR